MSEFTPEQERVIDERIARAISGLWHDLYPVIAQMVPTIVDNNLALAAIVKANPWLKGRDKELLEIVMRLKGENPNAAFAETLHKAVTELQQKGTNDG